MFPEKEGICYKNLQLTPEGAYSITKRDDGNRILQKMISIIGLPANKDITDLTGGVGGDTILFGLHFKTVTSIEYNSENFKALSHNIHEYNLNNVSLHFGDSTKIYTWKTDVLYIDPPWGGPEYKEQTNLDLFIGNTRIDLFLETILGMPWKPAYIFLKLPRNYNFSRLSTLAVHSIHTFMIRGFKLVAMVV